jgi:hypothetical protein
MVSPPEKTIAIVVDISKEGGRLKIFDKPTDEYIGTVAAEDSGRLVMVPWNSRWWYYSIGSLEVRYIKGSQDV